MKKITLTFLLALTTFFLFGSVAQAKLLLYSGWESGEINDNQQFGKKNNPSALADSSLCCSHSVSVVSSPSRAGNKAVKFETRASDPPIINGQPRAELPLNLGTPPDSERWYGWSEFLPSDWVDGKEGFLLVGQWHGAPDGVTMSLRAEKGFWVLRHQTGSCYQNETCDDFVNDVLWTEPLQSDKGKWTDFVFHVKFSSNKPGGFIEMWKNGVKKVDYKGPTDFTGSVGPFFKFGLYYQSTNATFPRVIYYDELRVGDENSSYDEVKPTGSANADEPPSSTSSSGGSTSSSSTSSSGGTYTPRFCHQYSGNSTIPAGFGSPWNLFSSAKNLILKAFCNTTTLDVTAGEASDLLYTYKEGYVTKNGSSWTKYTMTGQDTQGDWIIGTANASVPMTASQQSTQNWLLSYSCFWTGSEWKCGCRTSDCTGSNGNMWQIQGIKR